MCIRQQGDLFTSVTSPTSHRNRTSPCLQRHALAAVPSQAGRYTHRILIFDASSHRFQCASEPQALLNVGLSPPSLSGGLSGLTTGRLPPRTVILLDFVAPRYWTVIRWQTGPCRRRRLCRRARATPRPGGGGSGGAWRRWRHRLAGRRCGGPSLGAGGRSSRVRRCCRRRRLHRLDCLPGGGALAALHGGGARLRAAREGLHSLHRLRLFVFEPTSRSRVRCLRFYNGFHVQPRDSPNEPRSSPPGGFPSALATIPLMLSEFSSQRWSKSKGPLWWQKWSLALNRRRRHRARRMEVRVFRAWACLG
jgi:hypothetical protein